MTKFNTGNPVGSADPRDLSDNAKNLDEALNGGALTWTDRRGNTRKTFQGAVSKIGYEAPISYSGGISFSTSDTTKTVEEAGVVYAPLPSSLPFTSDGVFSNDADRFYPVQGLVEGDAVIPVTSRTVMKSYDVPPGRQFSLEEGGRSGRFVVKAGTPPGDPNEGIYIVLANGNYAERTNLKKLTPEMFGAAGDNSTDDTTAIEAAINMADSLKLKLWITNRHIVSGSLPFPSYLHIVAMPWARIIGNFAGPMFLDPKYEAADGHSDGQTVEHLVASNQGGDVYHVQPRNMKISYGRISAMTGYGVKISSASDQAFENFFDHVLFKGCKYPIWSRGKSVDPVTSEAAYAFDASDSWVTNCIFDGYAGASPVMEYSYVYGGSGWFFRNNHWYGTLASQFLTIKGLNVSIADYFERNGTNYGVHLLSGNPCSYNLAGSTFWLSAGGKAAKFDQGSFHTAMINFGGAVITGGDSSSNVIDVTYVQSGSSASNAVIDMAGVVVPKGVGFASDTLRVFGIKEPLYKEDSSGAPVTWFDGDLREENIYNKTDAFSASLQLSSIPTDYRGKRLKIYNASASQAITITAGATIIKPDGTTATSYSLPAQSSCLLLEQGGDFRIVLM